MGPFVDREQGSVNKPASSLARSAVISTALCEAEACAASQVRDATFHGAQGEGICYQGHILSSRMLISSDA